MKILTKSLLILVFVVGGAWFVWEWFFCRFYVAPDHMAIITAKTGEPLPAGQILANPGQMGIQEEVLGEGRHFRDPFLYDREIREVVTIPAGKIGQVTAKVGQNLPEGEFLAGKGQKGIQRRVLGPGKYRINPYGYEITVLDAISIPIGYAGVITSLSGRQAPEGGFAGPGEKGVREAILQPGLYYANPKEFQISVLEIGVNQVSLLGREGGAAVITKGQLETQNAAMEALQEKVLQEQQQKRRDYMRAQTLQQAEHQPAPQRPQPGRRAPGQPYSDTTQVLNQFVEFPSRDGFKISLDMTVEFELLPEHIAWIYRSYGDLPAVVDKIIMPQILSISRNKGSEYRAKDFIVGEGREKFQKDITDALAKTMLEKKIIIHNALIRHVEVPSEILDPIQKASLAVEQDLTNKEKQNTARKSAELNTELSLIEQRGAEVAQETQKIKAETIADQEKQVAELQANTMKQVAEIDRETAGIRADKVRKLGQAEADAIKLVEGELANGFKLKASAIGDPESLNLLQFAESLNSNLNIRILHAGPGTLWTDLQKASLGDLGGAKVIQQQK